MHQRQLSRFSEFKMVNQDKYETHDLGRFRMHADSIREISIWFDN